MVLLERGRLTCGTTWHAAGLIMQLRGTHAMTELARVNVELYSSLEAETGHATGFKQNGTLGVCRTRDRLHETMRTATIARSFGIEAEMHWPHRQREAARPVRKSTLHDRWAARNACFGEAMGWERPLWFAPEGTEPVCAYSWQWPNLFDHTADECRAVRTGVVVLDQSSFGKHLVQGRDACRELQRLCAGDVDVPPGKLVYTHMLNRRGGIECDITVNRLGENRFLLVSSATTQPRDFAWMERNLDPEAHVSVSDVTGAWAVLSVQGPKSRAFLGRLTDTDLSNDGFPFATSREIDVGHARVIANRLTYVGELGWELIVPTEFAQDACDRLLAEGEGVGLQPAGYHALEHLRSERAYREYELDLTPEDTPFEAGLGFTVQLDKPHAFIGRDALLRQKEAGPLARRLVMFRLKDRESVLFGEEVIRMDGRIAGYVSSGAYGFTLGASVGMGYIRHPDGVTRELVESASWEIEIACERYPAEASLRAFHDPAGTRVRS